MIKHLLAALWGVFVLDMLLAVAVADTGWELEQAESEAGMQKRQVAEAVLRRKGFINSFEMRVGCRYSFPVPGIKMRMPSLSTDIMEPEHRAAVVFTDDPNNPKKYETGITFAVIVKSGDIVLIPTGNDEQSARLEQLYKLMQDSVREHKSQISMYFIQNSHRRRIDLNLRNFERIYEVVRADCNEMQ